MYVFFNKTKFEHLGNLPFHRLQFVRLMYKRLQGLLAAVR